MDTRRIGYTAALVVLLAMGAWLVVRSAIPRPRVSEREVREAVHTALQREADTAFVVTGYVDVIAATRVEDTRVLLPNVLDWRLGTTRAAVRVPGRVSYGFDASELRPEMIRVFGDTLEIELPRLVIHSAEPAMDQLQVETTTGWARFRVTAQEAERRAVQLLSQALRQQGQAHLDDSLQPRINTAKALEALLTPVLRQMGVADPQFRIRLGDGLIVEPAEAPP